MTRDEFMAIAEKEVEKIFESEKNGIMNLVARAWAETDVVKPVVDVDTWICGNCGHRLEHHEMLGDNILFYDQYDYCPQCGRKVKWE